MLCGSGFISWEHVLDVFDSISILMMGQGWVGRFRGKNLKEKTCPKRRKRIGNELGPRIVFFKRPQYRHRRIRNIQNQDKMAVVVVEMRCLASLCFFPLCNVLYDIPAVSLSPCEIVVFLKVPNRQSQKPNFILKNRQSSSLYRRFWWVGNLLHAPPPCTVSRKQSRIYRDSIIESLTKPLLAKLSCLTIRVNWW